MVKILTQYITRTRRPLHYNTNNGAFYYTLHNGLPWRRIDPGAPYHMWSRHPASGNYTNVNITPRIGYIANLKRQYKAIAKFQALWRGYTARQNIRHPRPNNSKALAKMAFMEKRNNKSGRRYNARTHRSRTGLENIRRLFN